MRSGGGVLVRVAMRFGGGMRLSVGNGLERAWELRCVLSIIWIAADGYVAESVKCSWQLEVFLYAALNMVGMLWCEFECVSL